MLNYGPSLGFLPLREWLAEWQGVTVDRVLTSNGSLQLIEFLCLQMLKAGDVVFTEAPTYDRTIGAHATARREGRGHSARRGWSEHPGTRTGPGEAGPEVLLRHPGLSKPGRGDLLGGQTSANRRVGRAARFPDRGRRALSAAALSREGRSHALPAGSRAHAAHGLVHQDHCARRPYGIHDRRAGDHREAGEGGGGHVHLPGLRRAGHRARVVPPRAPGPADRASEEALRAAPRCVPRGHRQVHARGRGDASRRRVLPLAHACPKGR